MCPERALTMLEASGAAGRPGLQGDVHGDTDERLQHSTFRDVTPHSFTTQSRPAASVRAATGEVRRPTKPPLPVPALQPVRRTPARGGSPMRASCSGVRGSGDGATAGRPAGVQAAWDGLESDDSRCMLAHVEVLSAMPSPAQSHASPVQLHVTAPTMYGMSSRGPACAGGSTLG